MQRWNNMGLLTKSKKHLTNSQVNWKRDKNTQAKAKTEIYFSFFLFFYFSLNSTTTTKNTEINILKIPQTNIKIIFSNNFFPLLCCWSFFYAWISSNEIHIPCISSVKWIFILISGDIPNYLWRRGGIFISGQQISTNRQKAPIQQISSSAQWKLNSNGWKKKKEILICEKKKCQI